MSNWVFLNENRIRKGIYASTPDAGFNGAFTFMLPGEARRIYCIASDGEGWQHVSVSFGPNKSTPSWELMCKIKELFFEDEDAVVQFHPAKSQYVNNHAGCLHLWRPTEQTVPTPPPEMVGLMELNP